MDSFEFEPFNIDDNLISRDELRNVRKQRSRKRSSNKQKAEMQFDTTAKPIKLEVFFKDMLELAPDIPDSDIEIDGSEDVAPMIFQPNIYPSNSDELAVDILETANNYLEMEEQLVVATTNISSTSMIEEINNQMTKIQTVSLTADVDQHSLNVRHEAPKLTAKRFSVKALQMFSFNENYKKHFNINVDKLRALNTDCLIDQTEDSVLWLNRLGTKFKEIYLNLLEKQGFDPFPSDDLSILNELNPEHPFFRALGFSIILKNLDVTYLSNIHLPLNAINSVFNDTNFRFLSMRTIFDYFQLKMFGHEPELNFQLNYLDLIPYYLKKNKKKMIYSLFTDLDFKNKQLF